MELFIKPASIECDSAYVQAKLILSVKGIFSDGKIGTHCRCDCSRDGEAEIKKELNPKAAKKNIHSNLNLGDKIIGEKFTLCISGFRIPKKNKTNYSGRHNTNYFTTQCYTYAELTKPFEHISNGIMKKELDNSSCSNQNPEKILQERKKLSNRIKSNQKRS